jgi:GR25 family glycosyltransferase involved in LPS biosynthesis
MTFLNDVDVFYINLDSRNDRRQYIEKHLLDLGIDNFKRVKAHSPKDFDDNIAKEGLKLGVNEFSVAGSYSHLLAMQQFLKESDKEIGFIIEDDADLSNVKKLKFSITDMFDYVHNEVGCLQLSVSTREDIVPRFNIRIRDNWDFCAGAYLITRQYAKKVTDHYLNNGYFNIENFKPKELFDYRNGGLINTIPVPESIVYNLTNTVVFPIFTYIISETSMSFSTEAQRQEIKSQQDFIRHWEKYNEIYIRDMA